MVQVFKLINDTDTFGEDIGLTLLIAFVFKAIFCYYVYKISTHETRIIKGKANRMYSRAGMEAEI